MATPFQFSIIASPITTNNSPNTTPPAEARQWAIPPASPTRDDPMALSGSLDDGTTITGQWWQLVHDAVWTRVGGAVTFVPNILSQPFPVTPGGTYFFQVTAVSGSPTRISFQVTRPSGIVVVPTPYKSFLANISDAIKGTPGNVLSIYAWNIDTTDYYLQFHNKATAPVNGNVPFLEYFVPRGSASANSALIIGADELTEHGVAFSTGIAFGQSTTGDSYTAAATAKLILNVMHS
jgi:hypothetical protein